MEKRVFSSINPYVSAGCSVHCSSCSSEVKPAMSIERGYAVEAVSFVEPLNSPKEAKTQFMWRNNGIADLKAGNSETEAKTTFPVNTVEIVEVDDDKAKVISQVNDVIEDNMHPVYNEDDSDELTDETVIEKNSGSETIVQTNSSENETVAQSNSSEEESEQPNNDLDQSDTEETDMVRDICIVSPREYNRINLALDKARFCLQKTNCTTLKRTKELSQEGIAQIEAIKKLVEENIPKEGSTLIADLSSISKEMFKILEALKFKMLDCQLESLLDTVNTLKKDLETELATLDEMEQTENVMPNNFEIATPDTDPLMNFLKDTPWVFFGLISILAANLGYFSQHWLLQSLHTSALKFSGYLKNITSV